MKFEVRVPFSILSALFEFDACKFGRGLKKGRRKRGRRKRVEMIKNKNKIKSNK